ncbi:MAG: hypothetical protein FJ279_35950 [Planctomycetes bacterium]|nr:hypothetical protein [Planctomycetota bacterium]
MFEVDDKKYPKSWKEMSFDFKLFFVFHGCMMVLFMVGRAIPIQALITIVSALLVVLAGLSIHHRTKFDWHWPGVGIKGVLSAVLSIALGLFFLGAATPRISPLNPAAFPWFAAGGGIIVFWILSSLKIVFQSESEFQSHCGDQRLRKPEPAIPSSEEPWKKAARTAFSLYFFAVWIAGVSFFWKFNTTFRDGTPEPTPDRTETLTNHGKTVYITAEEKKVVSLLQYSMMVGIPSALLLGALLHFVVGVKLFPNMPTLADRMRKTSQPDSPDD